MDEVAEAILALGEGTRLNVLFPVASTTPPPESEAKTASKQVRASARPAKAAAKAAKPVVNGGDSLHTETLKARLAELRSGGFNRLYQQGRIFEFSTPESLLDLDFTLPVFVLLDRIVVSDENRARIVDAAEIAYRESGEVIFEEVPRDEAAERKRHRFSAAYECKSCHKPGREPEPRLFSFNNPFGACPRCQGFGNTVDFDLNLVIPDKNLSLNQGAIDPWNRPKYRPWFSELRRHAAELQIPMDVPWCDLRGQIAPGNVEANAQLGGVLAKLGEPGAVLGAVPGIDCAGGERERFVGDDEVEVEVHGVAEALATGTCAKGIVEAEEARLRLAARTMAALALVRGAETVARALCRLVTRELLEDHLARFAIGDLGGVDDARAILLADDDAVQKDEDGQREVEVEERLGRGKLEDASLLVEAVEAGGAQLDEARFEGFV